MKSLFGSVFNKPTLTKRNRLGFSLLETLIVLSIAALVVLSIQNFGADLRFLQNLVGQQLQSHSDIDQTLQLMTREIRSAGPSSIGGYPIDSAGTSSFTFYSDLNQDGIFERVHYFLGTSTLQKGVITPVGNPLVYATSTEVVTTVVNNIISTSTTQLFSYYGSNYTGSGPALSSTVDVSQIRIVKVNFYSDVDTGNAPGPLFFSDTIDIRNLRSN